MRGLLGEGDSVPGTKDPVTGGKAAGPGDPDDADGGGGAAGGNGGDDIRHRSSFQRVPLCGMGKHGDTMRDRILKWALPIGMSPTFSLLQQGARRTAARMQHGATLRHENARFYRGDAPRIFFLRHQKENAPCTVEKKKCQG